MGGLGYDAKASFFDASGKLVAGPLSVTDGAGDVAEATVGCGAGSCVFAWTSSAGGGIVTRAFGASGAPSGPPMPIAGTSGLRAPRLAWDGQQYVLAAAATKVGPADLVAAWLDASGAPKGGGFTTVASGALGTRVPIRLASDGAGDTAVTYMRFQDQRAVVYVLTPPPAQPDAGPEAGPVEAGAPDAGPQDGGGPGAEGGTAEAGVADAGTEKSGGSGCGCTQAGGAAPALPAGGLLTLTILALRRRRARLRSQSSTAM